jgi:hypothetical protein
MDKIEKLKQLLTVIQNDTITPAEVDKFLTMVLGFIKQSKDSFEKLSQENIQVIKDSISYIKESSDKYTELIDSKSKKLLEDYSNKISEIDNKLSEIKKIKSAPGKNGKDGNDGYTPIKGIDYFDGEQGTPGKDGSPDTGEQIANKLEALEGEAKLDFKALKNVPEFKGGKTGGVVARNIYQMGDVSLTSLSNNDVLKWDDINKLWVNGTGGTGGGHTIQDEGTPLTQRTNLNFVGAGVAVTDDAGNDATIVTISAGGGAIDGSGTATYLAQWTDTDTLENSDISETSGTVVINTKDLQVKGGAVQLGATGVQLLNSSGNLALASGYLLATSGGTNQTSYTVGDILYADTTTTLAKLGMGTTGQFLAANTGAAPSWGTPSGSGTVTSVGITAGNLIDVSGSPVTTSGNITVDVDLSELATSTTDADGDFFAVIDSTNAQYKLTKANINLSGFNNDSAWTNYTDEKAQDAVGTILVDSSEIDFTYDDAAPSITASIVAGSIDETKLDTSVNASLDLADSSVQLAFKTIAVSGQSDVVADSATDTLTLAAGSNITITTNAGTDTITIASSGGGGSTSQYIDQTPDNGTYGLLAGTVNGSNAVFTTSLGSYGTGTLQVYLNGVLQLQGATDDWQETTPASGTFTFNTAPSTGDIITAIYQNAAGSTTGIIAKDEGSTLTSAMSSIDFVGAGVTATNSGGAVTVTISATGGGYTQSTVTAATVNATATSGHVIYLADATSNAITINLPTAVGNTAMFTINKIDSSVNTVTTDAFGTETINGATTQVANFINTSITIISDGANWFRI